MINYVPKLQEKKYIPFKEMIKNSIDPVDYAGLQKNKYVPVVKTGILKLTEPLEGILDKELPYDVTKKLPVLKIKYTDYNVGPMEIPRSNFHTSVPGSSLGSYGSSHAAANLGNYASLGSTISGYAGKSGKK